jgi:hypothetical protein
MKPHYFDQDRPDSDDIMLRLCVEQGYVPRGCLLGGQIVWGLVNQRADPCRGCAGSREKCRGRLEVKPCQKPSQPSS